MEQEVERLRLDSSLTHPHITVEREVKAVGQTVPNTLDVPYRWVCKLVVEENRPKGWSGVAQGSGVLVGPCHVLTAAHTLEPYYNKPAKDWRVKIWMAFDGTRYITEEISSDVRLSEGWKTGLHKVKENLSDMGAYDYAMVILPSDISSKPRKELKNNSLGHWGHSEGGHRTVFAPLKAELLEGNAVYCAGYPKGVKRAMWVAPGNLSNVLLVSGDKVLRRKRGMNNTALASLGEDARGMSGGPVWITVKSTLCLVGINTDVSPVITSGPDGRPRGKKWIGHAARVTIELFNEVRGWMKSIP